MRLSTTITDSALAPSAGKPWRNERVLKITGMVACALGALIGYHAPGPVPPPPPLMPAPFEFEEKDGHIRAQGCFVGGHNSRINQQEIDADLAHRTVELHGIDVLAFDSGNQLAQTNLTYRIDFDDGNVVVATCRDSDPNGLLRTLHLVRKSRTISTIEQLPVGVPVVAELKDGRTIYRDYVLRHRDWTW